MNKIIIISIAVLGLIACEEKHKIDVLPDYSVEYLSESKLTQQVEPKIKDFEKSITNEFQSIIQKINDETNGKYTLYPIGYNLFINENGKIDKVSKIEAIEIEPKGDYIFNNENKLMDEITKEILPKMESWEFIPAKLFDKNVASQKSIKALFSLDENGSIVIRKPFNIKFDDELFLLTVEQMPAPIGGIAAIQKNITYPEIAKRAGIQGRVFVKAYVDSSGIVVKTELLRGIGAGCDEIAMTAVKKVKFVPGKQKGKPVNVQVTVPILFKLQ